MISKCQQFSTVHHDSRKGRKIYWASGNKVLDTFSTIQADIIMSSAIWFGALKFESGSVPSDKNVTQNTRLSFYTYVKVWAREYYLIRYTVPGLCIRTASSISIWSWGTLACLLAVKLEERLSSLSLPCSSLSQQTLSPQVSMTMFWFGVQCMSNCFTNKPDAKTHILVSIRLLICCLQFLLWNMTTCPEVGLQPNSFPDSTNRLAIN